MIILGIDTSCDDTCVSIVRIKNQGVRIKDVEFRVLSNVISSQVAIHQKYGGVYPALAKREHQRNLAPVLKQALSGTKLLKSKIKNKRLKTQIKNKKLKEILKREEVLCQQLKKFFEKYERPKIDVIAVTVGPGLEPCLWIGVNFARALSYFWDVSIIPINHIEAHIFANFINKFQVSSFKFQELLPAIALVVSGGHTQLILMRSIGNYKIIGETRDDAAGECLDKTARILGLGYPGGPVIAVEAAKFSIFNFQFSIKLPRPMIQSKDYDFSFSGLKTAVLYDFKKRTKKVRTSKEYRRMMAKEIQQAIIDVLIKKTIKATKEYKTRTIMLGGGVAANEELRKQFKLKVYSLKPKVNFLVPPKNLCTDNAAMIGVAGYFRFLRKETKNWRDIRAQANLKIA